MADPQSELIEADTFDDADSAVSVSTSSLASLRSSIWEHQVENGRTYHAMSSGKYVFPNDEPEKERLDIQHNLWLLTFHGALCLCPKEQGANRVLDVGTGTGAWAIDYADMHPEAEVIGADLSPIQSSLVPPNCSFEIDDLEKDWTWTKPFDFIFSRVMVGCFSDYQSYFDKAYAALEPGGYFELQDIESWFTCDDGTLAQDNALFTYSKLLNEASEKFGRPLRAFKMYKDYMEKAGFVDIVETQLKWPVGFWPKDKHYKELGIWSQKNLDLGLEGFALALLTRAFQWTKDETLVFCATVRKSLYDRRIHSYIPVHIIYGRKPELPASAEGT